MIIAIIGTPDGQLHLANEGCDPQTMRNVLAKIVANLDQQLNQSRIIVPPTAIPKNLHGPDSNNGHPHI